MSKCLRIWLYAAAALSGLLMEGCLGLGGANARIIWAVLREDLFS